MQAPRSSHHRTLSSHQPKRHSFIKMHGLGNDFLILDGRLHALSLTPDHVRLLADRRRGVGCDQVIYLEDPRHQQARVWMRIFNADGQEVNACGNGTRCIGFLLAQETGQATHMIETKAGLLKILVHPDHKVTVDMGPPSFKWQDIPLASEADTLYLPLLSAEGLERPTAVSMGNPHLVFFIQDLDSIDLQKLGEQLNFHALFPQGTNVEIVSIQNPTNARMRVYERGTGITPACATGACAALAAATHRGLMEPSAHFHLDGGSLDITYDQTLKMTGPVHLTFQGQFETTLFTQ